mgnify:FL=1|jgi:hypothetical protein BACCOPRO_03617
MHKSFRNTLRDIFTDGGLIIFLLVVPAIYPILYAFIYNEEVVRDVPVVVVDGDHSSLSRDFVRRLDAAPDVEVVAQANSLAEAQSLVRQRKAYGVVSLPSQMNRDLQRGTPVRVQVYCDMSGMLYYKAVLATTTDVALQTNARIKVTQTPGATQRQEEITTAPLTYEHVALYNPQSGFATFLLPAVLVLILQQTLILGIGMEAGTRRERMERTHGFPATNDLTLEAAAILEASDAKHREEVNRQRIEAEAAVARGEATEVKRRWFHPRHPRRRHAPRRALKSLLGRSAAYLSIYIPVSAFVLGVVPRLFDFPQLVEFSDLALFVLPYLLAAVMFGISLSALAHQRESIILIIVFTSVPMLFLSGVSWPASAMSWYWKTLGAVIPSTPAINGFVRLSSMGASLSDVACEWLHLWGIAGGYTLIAWWVTARNELRKLSLKNFRTRK